MLFSFALVGEFRRKDGVQPGVRKAPVFPVASAQYALPAESAFFQHAHRGRIARQYFCTDAVEPRLCEAKAQNGPQGFRHQPGAAVRG